MFLLRLRIGIFEFWSTPVRLSALVCDLSLLQELVGSALRFWLFLKDAVRSRQLKGFHFDGRVIWATKWTFHSAEGGRNSQKRWSLELFLRQPDGERNETHKSQLKWSSGHFLDMMHWLVQSQSFTPRSYITFWWTLETEPRVKSDCAAAFIYVTSFCS